MGNDCDQELQYKYFIYKLYDYDIIYKSFTVSHLYVWFWWNHHVHLKMSKKMHHPMLFHPQTSIENLLGTILFGIEYSFNVYEWKMLSKSSSY